MKIIILGSILFTQKIIEYLLKKNVLINGVVGKNFQK